MAGNRLFDGQGLAALAPADNEQIEMFRHHGNSRKKKRSDGLAGNGTAASDERLMGGIKMNQTAG